MKNSIKVLLLVILVILVIIFVFERKENGKIIQKEDKVFNKEVYKEKEERNVDLIIDKGALVFKTSLNKKFLFYKKEQGGNIEVFFLNKNKKVLLVKIKEYGEVFDIKIEKDGRGFLMAGVINGQDYLKYFDSDSNMLWYKKFDFEICYFELNNKSIEIRRSVRWACGENIIEIDKNNGNVVEGWPVKEEFIVKNKGGFIEIKEDVIWNDVRNIVFHDESLLILKELSFKKRKNKIIRMGYNYSGVASIEYNTIQAKLSKNKKFVSVAEYDLDASMKDIENIKVKSFKVYNQKGKLMWELEGQKLLNEKYNNLSESQPSNDGLVAYGMVVYEGGYTEGLSLYDKNGFKFLLEQGLFTSQIFEKSNGEFLVIKKDSFGDNKNIGISIISKEGKEIFNDSKYCSVVKNSNGLFLIGRIDISKISNDLVNIYKVGDKEILCSLNLGNLK